MDQIINKGFGNDEIDSFFSYFTVFLYTKFCVIIFVNTNSKDSERQREGGKRKRERAKGNNWIFTKIFKHLVLKYMALTILRAFICCSLLNLLQSVGFYLATHIVFWKNPLITQFNGFSFFLKFYFHFSFLLSYNWHTPHTHN